MRALGSLSGALALLLATSAFAGQPVTLKPQTTAQGKVTLGDLFDGAGAAAGVIVAPAPNPGGTMVLDTALVQRALMTHGLTWANETGVRRIIVQAGAAQAPATSTKAADVKGVDVLTWTRSLNAGEIVAAEDLTWTTLAAQPAGTPRDADSLIGMVVKRPLRSGATATTRDVGAPVVIKKDDMVSVAFNMDGVSLTLQAKAMGPASVGESFSLTNPQSKKVIQAVASGPGRAVVGPQAEALRAETTFNPSQFALR